MCPSCDELAEKVVIRSPEAYYDLKEKIERLVDEGVLSLIEGTCSLTDIFREKQWPADILQHDFQCTTCGRTFRLFADTYHGRSGWRALD